MDASYIGIILDFFLYYFVAASSSFHLFLHLKCFCCHEGLNVKDLIFSKCILIYYLIIIYYNVKYV